MASPWIKTKISRGQLEDAIRAVIPELDKALAEQQLKQGKLVAAAIARRAPRGRDAPGRYGHYADSLHAAYMRDKPARRNASNAVANQTKDKNAVGIYGHFYWIFLEYGTRNITARPHVFPTWRGMRRGVKTAIGRAIGKVVKQMKARA